MQAQTHDLIEDYTDEANDDFISLGQIASDVTSILRVYSASDIRSKSLEIVRALMDRDVFPGDLRREGFSFWPGTPDELIRRIEDAWIALKRTPDLDDICWFALRPSAKA